MANVEESRIKMANLYAVFDDISDAKIIEQILKTPGDINYAIPFSNCLSGLNQKLQPGTILHQMGKLNESKLPKILNLLIQYNADITVKNSRGQTALHAEFMRREDAPSKQNFSLALVNAFLSAHVDHSVRENPRDELTGITHFHIACTVQHYKAVKFFIDNGVDVDEAIDANSAKGTLLEKYAGFTALNFSVQECSIKMTEILLAAGADMLAKNIKGISPLYEVLVSTKTKLVVLFASHLRSHEDLQNRLAKDSGMSLMHIFAFTMDVNAIEELLESGMDVNARVKPESPVWPGCTPLHCWLCGAICGEYEDDELEKVLKLLLDADADVTLANTLLNTPLHLLSNWKISTDEEFLLAVRRSMLRSQKDYTVNPANVAGRTHFHISVQLYDVEVAEKYLKSGVDVNQPIDYFSENNAGASPLHLLTSVHSDYLDRMPERLSMLDLLLKHGADVHARCSMNNTPLHNAAMNDMLREEMFERIARAGAHVDAMNVEGYTPLALSLMVNNLSPTEIQFFIRQGCRLNLYNPADEDSGLLTVPYRVRAISKMKLLMIYEVLLESEDLKRADQAGRTAIHCVVSSRHNSLKGSRNSKTELFIDVIERLMKLGCDIDAQDSSGKTALHAAVYFSNDTAVSALLALGADINLVDNDGKSPLYYIDRYCNCIFCESTHFNLEVLEEIVEHVQLLQLAKLDVTDGNKNLLEEIEAETLTEMFTLTNIKTAEIEEIARIVVTGIWKIGDFLSETSAVAAYPTMSFLNRQAVDEFFSKENKVLKDIDRVVRGVLNLQYKKTTRRAHLYYKAQNALRALSSAATGIPMPELCCEHLLRLYFVRSQ